MASCLLIGNCRSVLLESIGNATGILLIFYVVKIAACTGTMIGIDKLDPKPREDFLKFLDEYAKSEDVAIIVSQLDSSINDATVKIR